MSKKVAVSRKTLWTVLDPLSARIKELRALVEWSRERAPEMYEFNRYCLEDAVLAYDEIACALGGEKMQNETEETA